MSRRAVLFSIVMSASASVLWCGAAAAQPALPTLSTLLQHRVQLKPELAGVHPRLFVTAAEIEQLRVRVKTMRGEVWRRAIATPVALEGPPPAVFGPKEPRAQSDVAYAIVEASLAYAIEQRPDCLSAARAWMLAAIDYETWGDTDDKPDAGLAAGHLLYAIGWSYDLLYNALTPDERARVRKSLEWHAALVYDHFSLSAKKKWLAFTQHHDFIPTAGLGIAALALMGESADAPKWAALARAHQHRAATLLSPDGYYHEGMESWIAASPWLVHFLDAWEHCTGESLWELGPYKNWKFYVAHMLLPDGQNVFDFGDAWEGPLTRAKQGDAYARAFPGGKLQSNYNVLYRVASRFKDAEAQAVAARLAAFGHSNREEYWTLLWYDASLTPAPMSALPLRYQFKDSGVVFWRNGWSETATAFAVKAGPPEGHAALAKLAQVPEWAPGNDRAHPDAGSFIIYSQGRYLTGGAGNTITIDHRGQGQGSEGTTHDVSEGVDVRALDTRLDTIRVTRADFWDDAATIALDAAGAYAAERGVTRFTRTLTFATTGTFRVVDDVETSKAAAVQWRLHSDTPFSGSGQRWTATNDGVALNVAITAPAAAAASASAAMKAKVTAEKASRQLPGRPGSIAEGTRGERGAELMIESASARQHRFDVRLTVRSKAWTPGIGVGGHGGGNITSPINPPLTASELAAADKAAAESAAADKTTADKATADNATAGKKAGDNRDSNAGADAAARVRPVEYRDVTYSTVNGRPLQLDIYQHPAAQRPGAAKTPVFVFIHGGGWSHGERPASYGGFRPVLDMGASVVTVEYRLSGEAPAPAAVQDTRCALAWINVNAETYRFDPSRIIVFGTSAGGHLALMTAMPPPGTPGVDRQGCGATPRVAAVLDFYGPTDMAALATMSGSPKRWLGDRKDFDAFAEHMSPVTYVRPGLPPIFIIHGDADPTVPYGQSRHLHDALTEAGVPTHFITVPGGLHGNFSSDAVQSIWTAIREFLTQEKLLAAPAH